MVPVKKVGKTFYEFLLIKQQTKLLDQRKQISETVQAQGPELLQESSGSSKDEWKDLWSGKRPDKTFQLDGICNTETHSSPSEDGRPDDSTPAHVFLKSLKEGTEKSSRPQGGQAEKTLTKQEQKQAKEQKKQEQKKIKESQGSR